ncbi:hypothetical protein F3K46_02745 [Thermoanaerobacterium thermosaccharolyticum]|nr:hypothetical protein [Thermoanaerobacterium thermosaccharolyticum]MBE0227736.1 hypothetical protein [Thermoanaerobacterium thermosaccharolyticum]
MTATLPVKSNKLIAISLLVICFYILYKSLVNLLHPIEDEASYFIDRCLLLFTAGLTQSP